VPRPCPFRGEGKERANASVEEVYLRASSCRPKEEGEGERKRFSASLGEGGGGTVGADGELGGNRPPR